MHTSTTRQRLVLRLLSVFALIGLVLGAVGVYGVVAFAVTQRHHEIGLRVALGARHNSIVAMVLRHGLRFAAAGVVVGTAGALALTRYMQGVLYQVTPSDPLTYAAVAAVIILVTLLASWIPAHRAARTNPLVAMRGD
jgi:ABC-type antimicrobial peptide transport system permease subunit